MNEREIFIAALKIDDESQRMAFLEHACAGDIDLRARVAGLLEALNQAGSFLEHPAVEPSSPWNAELGDPSEAHLDLPNLPEQGGSSGSGMDASDYSNQPTLESAPGDAEQESSDPARSQPEEPWQQDKTQEPFFWSTPGTIIAGRYTLLEKIGEGGMGEVWIAKQSEPVRRKVAIKLIKFGMDSRSVLTRFEQERQALAMMDHTNIAKVLDGGMTSTGQPYFVMELVNGLAVNKFCDQAKLTPRERLELFVPICHAVQHAHQKGIVHRDLKPANILVTVVDGKPVPKVIDFGVAKAIGGKLTEETLWTQFGAVVGTLEYMSPEQAGYSGMDIDTRSDIYSLGVVLYELLTGVRPIDSVKLKHAAMTEMIRMIVEDEPSRPSTRLSTEKSLPSVAALRQMEPKKLMALLRGELDWVIMKCLEKHRDRRYDSAAGLANDIQRILLDEPVEARPPSTTYRMGKFIRRHRWPVIATGLLLAALLVGFVGTALGFYRAEQQRALADAAMQSEAERAEGERLAKEELAIRLSQVEKSNLILASVFENLNPNSDADEDRPLRTILADNLDEAVRDLDRESVGDPMIVSSLQKRLGHALVYLGRPAKGLEVLKKGVAIVQKEFGENDRRTLAIKDSLAGAHVLAGQPQVAIEMSRRNYEQAVELFGPDDEFTIHLLANLGAAYQTNRQLDEARALLSEALDRLRDAGLEESDEALLVMNNLATCYGPAESKSHTIPLLEESLRLTRRRFGSDHARTYQCMINLGKSYHRAMDDDAARPLLEDAYHLTRKDLGPDNPFTLQATVALAELYRDLGELEALLPLVEQVAAVSAVRYGPNHPETFEAQNRFAAALWSTGDYDRAIPMLEDLLRHEEQELGRSVMPTLLTVMNLGSNYMDVGRVDEALPLLEEAYRNADVDPKLLESATRIAELYRADGREEEGLQLLEEAAERSAAVNGKDSAATWLLLSSLGTKYYDAGRLDRSIPLFEDLVRTIEENSGPNHFKTLEAKRNLALNYQMANRHEEALVQIEEILEHVRKRPNEFDRGFAQELEILLANSLAERGQESQAIELLEAAIEKLRDQPEFAEQVRLARSHLAGIHWDARRLAKSIPLYQELLESDRSTKGDDHPETLLTMWNLATNLQADGRTAMAIEQFKQAKEILDRNPSIDFPPTRERLINSLVMSLGMTEQRDEATELLEAWFAAFPEPQGPYPDIARKLAHSLAVMHFRSQRQEKAIPILEQLLDKEQLRTKKDAEYIVQLHADLAINFKQLGRIEDAIPHLERAIQYVDRVPMAANLRMPLVENYQLVGRHDDAAKLLKIELERARSILPADDPRLASLLAMYATSLVEQEDFEQAEPIVRECLTIREKAMPDNWLYFNAKSLLGAVLMGRQEFAEAEPILLEAYHGMQQREAAIPPEVKFRVKEAAERLVEFYQTSEQPKEVEKWQAEIERLDAEVKQ